MTHLLFGNLRVNCGCVGCVAPYPCTLGAYRLLHVCVSVYTPGGGFIQLCVVATLSEEMYCICRSSDFQSKRPYELRYMIVTKDNTKGQI